MNDIINGSPDSFPVGAWTWHDGKGGIFSTQVLSTGEVRQQRRHVKDEDSALQKLGALSPSEAAAFFARCRDALSTPAPATDQVAQQNHIEGESYELVLAENAGQKSSRRVARAALSSDVALQNIRGEVLGARKQSIAALEYLALGARAGFS